MTLYEKIFDVWSAFLSLLLFPGRIGYKVVISFPIWLYYRIFFGTSDKRVVVIGGGFGGTEVAKILQNFAKVDMIDSKGYFEFTPSVLRAVVAPTKLKQIQIPLSDCLPLTNTHVGTVVDMDTKEGYVSYTTEKTSESKAIPYDYLVIASGSSYQPKTENPNVIASTKGSDLVGSRDKLEVSDRVIVIGGGYVGVELAAEIATTYPKKKVILVHSRSRLLSRGSKSASKYALDFFQAHNVQVILEESVNFAKTTQDEENPVQFITRSGMTINGDLAYTCIGCSPSSDYMDASALEQGFVKNNAFLKTNVAENVFTCGDVASIDEEKLAQSAQRGASVVAHNILCKIHEKPNKIRAYRSATLPIIISLGKYDAVFTWGPVTLRGFWASLMKEVVEWKVLISY